MEVTDSNSTLHPSDSQPQYHEEFSVTTSNQSESFSNSLDASRTESNANGEKRSKTLTKYSLLMLNFIPATIIH